MEINIPNLQKELKNKNYNKCNSILHDSIKNSLILEIKKHKADFQYSDLNDLKNKSIDLLDENLADIAIDFYVVSITDENPIYELSVLIELYENLMHIKV